MGNRAIAALLIALVCAAPAAHGQSWLDWTHAKASDSIGIVAPADAILIGASAVLWGGAHALRHSLAPTGCRWCTPREAAALGDGKPQPVPVNAVDEVFHQWLTGRLLSRKTADTMSSVIAFGIGPAFGIAGAAIATGPHASPGAGGRATPAWGSSCRSCTRRAGRSAAIATAHCRRPGRSAPRAPSSRLARPF